MASSTPQTMPDKQLTSSHSSPYLMHPFQRGSHHAHGLGFLCRPGGGFTIGFPFPRVKGRRIEPSQPQRRSKTYSGCWTFQARHIKCDEQRPSCNKCLTHGLVCEGYHLRLSWVGNPKDERESAFAPARVFNTYTSTPMSSGLPRKSSIEIAAVMDSLSDCPESPNGSIAHRVGPFFVFSVREATEPRSESPVSPLSRE